MMAQGGEEAEASSAFLHPAAGPVQEFRAVDDLFLMAPPLGSK